MVFAPRLTREELNKVTNGALEQMTNKWFTINDDSLYVGQDLTYTHRDWLVNYLGTMAALEADLRMEEDGSVRMRYAPINDNDAAAVIDTLVIKYLVQLTEVNIVIFSWCKHGRLYHSKIIMERGYSE